MWKCLLGYSSKIVLQLAIIYIMCEQNLASDLMTKVYLIVGLAIENGGFSRLSKILRIGMSWILFIVSFTHFFFIIFSFFWTCKHNYCSSLFIYIFFTVIVAANNTFCIKLEHSVNLFETGFGRSRWEFFLPTFVGFVHVALRRTERLRWENVSNLHRILCDFGHNTMCG